MYKLFSAEACPYVGARVSLPQPSTYIIAYAVYAICIFCNLLFIGNAFFLVVLLQL